MGHVGQARAWEGRGGKRWWWFQSQSLGLLARVSGSSRPVCGTLWKDDALPAIGSPTPNGHPLMALCSLPASQSLCVCPHQLAWSSIPTQRLSPLLSSS